MSEQVYEPTPRKYNNNRRNGKEWEDRRKYITCRYYLRNNCINSNCPYSHDPNTSTHKKKSTFKNNRGRSKRFTVCKFFLKNQGCKKDNCKFLHVLDRNYGEVAMKYSDNKYVTANRNSIYFKGPILDRIRFLEESVCYKIETAWNAKKESNSKGKLFEVEARWGKQIQESNRKWFQPMLNKYVWDSIFEFYSVESGSRIEITESDDYFFHTNINFGGVFQSNRINIEGDTYSSIIKYKTEDATFGYQENLYDLRIALAVEERKFITKDISIDDAYMRRHKHRKSIILEKWGLRVDFTAVTTYRKIFGDLKTTGEVVYELEMEILQSTLESCSLEQIYLVSAEFVNQIEFIQAHIFDISKNIKGDNQVKLDLGNEFSENSEEIALDMDEMIIDEMSQEVVDCSANSVEEIETETEIEVGVNQIEDGMNQIEDISSDSGQIEGMPTEIEEVGEIEMGNIEDTFCDTS
eukprot:TRINITY_DN1246_c0_g1_i1.p1 TRINITY_DN1246_c0_g1~~TRINITY_DN1246_c0_g1_i1.p1  ORF type:complete len:466 (+),score=111.09 TRINITY_DN1246_c0_g1_i1:32-1429(+)